MRIALVGAMTVATMSLGEAAAAPDAAPAYVDENPNPPAALKMRELNGRVRDLGGTAIPRATVSLFAESSHALVATVTSDATGEFRFSKIDRGLYRVVVRVAGLCPANIPVNLDGSLLAHRRIEVTMQAKGLDTCSYALAK